jgi:ATP-binding cassette, subfamily B, bacterial
MRARARPTGRRWSTPLEGGEPARRRPDERINLRAQFIGNLRRISPYARPFRGSLLLASALVILGAGAALLEPWPLALLVDSILVDQPLPSYLQWLPEDRGQLVIVAVVGGLLLTLLSSGLSVVTNYALTNLDQRMVLNFRSDIFRHVQRLSMDFHDQRRTGEFMANINNRASSLGEVVVALPPMLQNLLTLAGMVVITYRIDAQLALVSLTVTPLLYYSTGIYGTRIAPQLRKVRGLEGRSLNIVHEAIQMIRVIVAFGREDHEFRRFRAQGEEAVDARVRLTVRQTLFSLGVNLITAAGTALVLGFGAYAVLRRGLTVGELLVVMSYVASVYKPLQHISETVTQIQEKFVSLEGAFELLDTPPAIPDSDRGVVVGRADGRLEFDDVAFSYPGRDRTLEQISFQIEPGQVVGIVGPTGAGKTTMLSLIPRFVDVEHGAIRLDGRDIRDVNLASLREQFSVVLQEPLLFTGTIEDNIRYGRLDATKDEVREAARAANAHAFIRRLPKSYRTKLGERGSQLSGGERQRISIARAFLKDAPVLLLDEPTSSVDFRTERGILEALGRLMEGRTTIMVAHRLSTIQRADLILVLQDGRILERGSHEDLLDLGGFYKDMYETQLGVRTAHRLLEEACDDPGAVTAQECEVALTGEPGGTDPGSHAEPRPSREAYDGVLRGILERMASGELSESAAIAETGLSPYLLAAVCKHYERSGEVAALPESLLAGLASGTGHRSRSGA